MIEPAEKSMVDAFLKTHGDWNAEGDEVLSRTIKTENYAHSMVLAGKIAELAEKMDHHPKLTIEWGSVAVTLTTHDAGNKITAKDIDMAKKISALGGPAFGWENRAGLGRDKGRQAADRLLYR